MLGLRMKKGFTLAELLIVVAIIGVLAAIAIPIFSRNLERAREATCMANRRSLYAQVIAEHILSYRPCSELFNEFVANAGKCPSEGVFSWEDSGNTGIIKCDYHDNNGCYNSGPSDNTPLHTTPNLDLWDNFKKGAVIQDESGTWIIMQELWNVWDAYNKGTTIADIVAKEEYSLAAVCIEHPSDIKDSSFTGTINPGDLYYDSKTAKYYYVTYVSSGEEMPQGGWVELHQ